MTHHLNAFTEYTPLQNISCVFLSVCVCVLTSLKSFNVKGSTEVQVWQHSPSLYLAVFLGLLINLPVFHYWNIFTYQKKNNICLFYSFHSAHEPQRAIFSEAWPSFVACRVARRTPSFTKIHKMLPKNVLSKIPQSSQIVETKHSLLLKHMDYCCKFYKYLHGLFF